MSCEPSTSWARNGWYASTPCPFLVPKVEEPETLILADERIRSRTDRTVWLMPILETAIGIERAFEIASAAESIVALTIGLEDYTADLGVAKTLEGNESLYARMRLVNAARAAGRQPIDSVFGDVADEEGLRAWAGRSRGLGFDGMGCVHPRQIRPIHEAFAPSDADLAKAIRIVEAFEEAEERGIGVVSLGSKMIDPPVVRRALRMVEIARRTGRFEEVSDD
ncbi:MAG: CoA ester lyase [Gemmatimonadota bacterium]